MLIFQLAFCLLNIVPVAQFGAKLQPMILFHVTFFAIFSVVMGYFKIFEFQGLKEFGILFALMMWGIFGFNLMICSLKNDYKYHRQASMLHIDTAVDQLCRLLVIPYAVKSVKLKYLRQLNDAFPGVRII